MVFILLLYFWFVSGSWVFYFILSFRNVHWWLNKVFLQRSLFTHMLHIIIIFSRNKRRHKKAPISFLKTRFNPKYAMRIDASILYEFPILIFALHKQINWHNKTNWKLSWIPDTIGAYILQNTCKYKHVDCFGNCDRNQKNSNE